MGDRDDQIKRLKKLMAHAKSAQVIGSEAEAQAFAAKVQRMIAQHNIDRAELEDQSDEDELNPIVEVYVPHDMVKIRRARVKWLSVLSDCIAYAHFCDCLVSPRTTAVWFVGRKHQAEMAVEVYATLARLAEEIADKEYVRYFYECRANGDVTKARGFRQSWLEGFAICMRDRYLEELRRIEDEAGRVKGAIVLFKSERQKVSDFVSAMFADKRLEAERLKTHSQYDLLKHPKFIRDFRTGKDWAVVRGKQYILGLFTSKEEAEKRIDELENFKPPKSKASNREGIKRGQAYAAEVDLGFKGSQKAIS